MTHPILQESRTQPEVTSQEDSSIPNPKTLLIESSSYNRASKWDADTLSQDSASSVASNLAQSDAERSTIDSLQEVESNSSDTSHDLTLDYAETNSINCTISKVLPTLEENALKTSYTAPEEVARNLDSVVSDSEESSHVQVEVSQITEHDMENFSNITETLVEAGGYGSQSERLSSEEESEVKEEDGSVGMLKRFTSTLSLRNNRSTLQSRESLKITPVPFSLSNRDSSKSSFSDGSSSSDTTLATPSDINSSDNHDAFSLLDDNSSIGVGAAAYGVESKNKSFSFKSPITHLGVLTDETAEANIDWEFWGMLISDYSGMIRKQSRLVSKNIQRGIPSSLRGPIWQLISKSKDSPLEILYSQLLEQISPFDKMITCDLSRTFPDHEFFQNGGAGQESLYNVVKAFSLYDTDVGYCQGISFIVGPLLLHMPEEEAFCVLVRLMRAYGLRGHFTPQMETLHLRLYQFDHLLEEHLPNLHKHMVAESITSSMYASQWFMTLFAYRFPLPLVFRIFDIIFAEGVDSLLRFAIALLKANHDKLLDMPFETLLDFLKHHLYHIYDGKIDKLISDAFDVKITAKRLDRLSRDYHIELKKQQAEIHLIESLKVNNKHLEDEVKTLEYNVQNLNEEHCELANEFVQCKLDVAQLQDENESLKFEVAQLKLQLEQSRKDAEQSVKQEMDLLARKNFELADQNTSLEDQLSELEAQLIEVKMQYAESENERVQLQKKWDDLRRAFR